MGELTAESLDLLTDLQQYLGYGCKPDVLDDFDDLFPGSGAVGRAWEAWCAQLPLEVVLRYERLCR